MLKALTLLIFALLYHGSYAQNVGINSTGATPDASAMLDVASTASPYKGFLAPRMLQASRGLISSPATGLLVYQTDGVSGFYYNSGTSAAPVWTLVSSTTPAWGLTGNASTTAGTNFLGTTDAIDFVFKTNNIERARILTNGDVVLGTDALQGSYLTKGKITMSNAAASGNDASDIYLEDDRALRISNWGYGNDGASIQLKAYDPDLSLISLEGFGGFRYYSRSTNLEKFAVSDVGAINFSGALMPNNAAGTAGYVLTSAGAGASPTWTDVATATSTSWNRVGNAGTTPGTTASPGSNYIGTSDAVDLAFRTSNTERMRIASGGAITLNGLASGSSSDYIMSVVNATNTLRKINPSASTSPVWSTTGNAGTSPGTYASPGTNYFGTSDATSLAFRTNNLERMRISSAGAVNIYAGTSQKDVLNVSGDYNEYTAMTVTNANTGNKASSDIVATNSGGWYIDMGINSTGYTTGNGNILNGINTSYIYSSAPGDFYIGNGYSSRDIIFFANYGSTNTNNTADGYEVMRIYGAYANGGNNAAKQVVTIGGGNPNGLNKLTVNGSVYASAYNSPSDNRLKKNIQGLNYGLKDVLRLRPVTYNWIDPQLSAKTQIGLIAQEAREIIPEMVMGDETKETLSVNYTELIPVLINAIKEQQKQIDDLKKQVENLQK